MIALNETLEYAAEIAFTLPSASDPLTGITGWTFTLGEVQIQLPTTGVWTSVAVNKIVEKSYGRYCARLTSSQCLLPGIVPIVANITGSTEQPYFGYDVIGTLGGDVKVSDAGHILFYLPNANDPVNAAITNANFSSAGTLRICLPDSAYRDATTAEKASVINLGFGGYAFPLTSEHTSKRGKAFLYAEYTGAQRFEGYTTILNAGEAPETEPIAIPVPIVFGAEEYVDHYKSAVNRLPQQFRSGTIF